MVLVMFWRRIAANKLQVAFQIYISQHKTDELRGKSQGCEIEIIV